MAGLYLNLTSSNFHSFHPPGLYQPHSLVQENRYDTLRKLEGDVPIPCYLDTKQKNAVEKWRTGVQRSTKEYEIGPPPNSPLPPVPCMPTSPVARIHPALLQVTSAPPSEFMYATRPEELPLPPAVDELADESDDDSEVSDGFGDIAVPPSQPTTQSSRSALKTHHIKWIPTRIKYSFLSFSRGIKNGVTTRS